MKTTSPRWRTCWRRMNGHTIRNNRWSVWTRSRSRCMPMSVPLLRPQPGREARRDNEYERCGTANVFCAVEPKAGRHFTFPTPDRSGFEFAQVARRLGACIPGGQDHPSGDGQPEHPSPQVADRSLRRRNRRRRSGTASPSTTRPPTEVGSIRRKSKSGSSRGNVWAPEESPTSRPCAGKREPGIGG